MLTAYDLGVLCACRTTKTASWLTEGVRSWFTPKQPEMTMTKDVKPQQQNFAKSNEPPFWQNKGLNKSDVKTYNQSYTNQSAQEQLQTQPKYDYFYPPTGHFKTQIKPYDYFKPLYDKYPGGYSQAIADSQRWQNDARLEGLHTWKPEDLNNPVDVRGGNFVGPYEKRQSTPLRGFTNKADPLRAGAYQSPNKGNNIISPNPNAIIMNPENSDYPATNSWLRSALGHELTHAMHRNTRDDSSREAQNRRMQNLPNVFKGHESKFPKDVMRPAGVGTSADKKTMLDYMGEPTEFGAYLSELRRDWIERNPGKRLSKPSEAEALLDDYTEKPKFLQPGERLLVPDLADSNYPGLSNSGYNRKFPVSLPVHKDRYKSLVDSEGSKTYAQSHLDRYYENSRKEFEKDPSGLIPLEHYNVNPLPERTISPNFQELLPTIMSDPELKKKAILQILSSVVKNRQQNPIATA